MPRPSLPFKVFGLLLLVTAVACFGLSLQTSVPGEPVSQGYDGARYSPDIRQDHRVETKFTVVDRVGYLILGIVFSIGALCCFAGARVYRPVRTPKRTDD